MTLPFRCLAIAALLLTALTLATAANATAPRQEECEENAIVARAYAATVAGLKIEVREGNRLFVNGRLVAHDPSGLAWADTVNTANIARAGDNIIILTSSDDCVDYTEGHFYIIRTDGRLRVFGPDRNDQGYDGFILRGKNLIYWHQSFCWGFDPDKAGNTSYTEVLKPGARTFLRVEKPFDQLCSRPARMKRNASSIRFRPMTAAVVRSSPAATTSRK